MRAATTPVLLDHDGSISIVSRAPLGSNGRDEAWLQELLHHQPTLLPIEEIEPAFETPVAVAREVSCGHGFIDNLLLTPRGDIIVVETKLYVNPQARREVVAQLMDYVAALSGMGFEDFERRVLATSDAAGKANLFSFVSDYPDALSQEQFIDAVSINLARGRMLALAVGDGIRRETEKLSDLLQSHAGAHFTFALVELATWECASGLLVVPSTLLQTKIVERGIVRLSADARGRTLVVEPPEHKADEKRADKRARSLTEIEFYEIIEARKPGLARAIQDFVESVEPLGVFTEIRRTLMLKADVGLKQAVNLGYIETTGKFWTSAVTWVAPEKLGLPYLEQLAALVGGNVVRGESWNGSFVAIAGRSAPRIEDYLPQHADSWRAAIAEFMERARRAEPEG